MFFIIIKIAVALSFLALAFLTARKYITVSRTHKNAFTVDREKVLGEFHMRLTFHTRAAGHRMRSTSQHIARRSGVTMRRLFGFIMDKSKQLKMMWWAMRHRKELQELTSDPEMRQALEAFQKDPRKAAAEAASNPALRKLAEKMQASFSLDDMRELQGLVQESGMASEADAASLFNGKEHAVDYFEKLVNITDSNAGDEEVTAEEQSCLERIKANPRDAEAYCTLGEFYLRQGKTKYARESLATAKRLGSARAAEHLRTLDNR